MCIETIQYNPINEFRILEQPYDIELFEQQSKDNHRQEMKNVIVIWEKEILMGFQLYEHLIQNEKPYNVETMAFSSKSQAISWVCSQQLKRNDLTEEYKKYLIGKKYESELELRSKKKQIRYTDGAFQAIGGNNSKYGIAKNIGDQLSLATGTVLKYGVYSQAVDRIMNIEEKLARMILMDEVRISHKNIITLSDQSEEAIEEVSNYIQDNQISHIGYQAIEGRIQWTKIEDPISGNSSNSSTDEPMIRKMPAYDPDAEISSLALTIPSWISSMERANEHTDYSKTSPSARIKLVKQLAILERTIYNVQKSIEEAN